MSRAAFWFPVALVAASTTACGDSPTEPLSGQRHWPSVSNWVSGTAATSLDVEGHFRFPVPDAVSTGTVLHPADAMEFMTAFVDTYIKNDEVRGNIRQSLSAQHGQAIDWERLEPLPNSPFFAHSYVVPPDLEDGIRHAFASHYLAIFQQREGVFAVVVALAAGAANLYVDADGRIRGQNANQFSWYGISIDGDLPAPLTAEHAVEVVVSRVDAKVSEVPTYILPRSLVAPWRGYWRVVLDRHVPVRNFDRALLEVDTLYVAVEPTTRGPLPTFYIPTPQQPASVPVEYLKWNEQSGEYQMVRDTFDIDPRVPVWYEQVLP